MFAAAPIQKKPADVYESLKSSRVMVNSEYIYQNVNPLYRHPHIEDKLLKKAIQNNDVAYIREQLAPKQPYPGDYPCRFPDISNSDKIHRYFLRLGALLNYAADSRCKQETRMIIYQCLVPENNLTNYVMSFFKRESIAPCDAVFNKLHLAAALNMKEECQRLLDSGYKFDVSSSLSFATTPLAFAIIFGHAELAKWFVSKGAKMDVAFQYSNSLRHSPLCIAAMEGHHDVVHAILDLRPKPPTEQEQLLLLAAASIYMQSTSLISLLSRFRKDASSLLLTSESQEKNIILFGIIEAGIQLPPDAPEDLHKAQKLWNEMHPAPAALVTSAEDVSRPRC